MCDPEDEDFEINTSQLTKRTKHLASVLNHFWVRWRSEYLNELRESHRYAAKKTSCPRVNKGDVVIVHDQALPRGLWKLGRIQEVYIGRDGLPRSASVRTATRSRQHTLLKRPLQRLYPLEICESEKPESPTVNSRREDPNSNAPASRRDVSISDVPTCMSRQDDSIAESPVQKRRSVRAAANERIRL